MSDNESKAWIITDVWSASGVRITVKASGESVRAAINDLYEGIDFGMQTFGWKTQEQPAPIAPAQSVPLTDENGTSIVDGEGQPQEVPLPQGTCVYTVKELWHAKSKDGTKDMLRVKTVEPPYNTKWGVSCFNAPIQGWKDWPVDQHYSPPDNAKQVIIEDPQGDSKYANVKDFR